jgi:large subunit ribosomal protein L35
MPKIKTNKLASKKIRVGGTGTVKFAQSNTSHNTGKKSSKKMRRLRGRKVVNKSNLRQVKGLLINSGVK